MAAEDRDFTHSTLRERIVEHVFGVLRTLWRRGITDVEILRPELNDHGYDVVMSRGPVVRHVQPANRHLLRPIWRHPCVIRNAEFMAHLRCPGLNVPV